MDTGEGRFKEYQSLIEAEEDRKNYPFAGGIFQKDEIVELKGSRFRVSQILPNYQEMASRLKKKLNVFERFEGVLMEFIEEIGTHSFKREPSSLPELLGRVRLDCMKFNKEYDRLLKLIEKES